MSSTTRWARSPAVAFVEDGERVAALPLDALDAFGARLLTGTAATIWRAVDEANDEETIIAAVARHYDVDAAAIRHDVRRFLDELWAQHLLVRL